MDYTKFGHWAIVVKFLGEWSIWRKGYRTKQKAKNALDYWRERMSWPLKIERTEQ